jgi:hypothetical protein
MARSDKRFQNIPSLHWRGQIVPVFLALCLLAQLAGCHPPSVSQKPHKATTIKSAPRTPSLVKQSPQTTSDQQIYLPFTPQMSPTTPLTHTSSPTAVTPLVTHPSSSMFGIDFGNHKDWVRIKIYPPNRRVNNGQPIVLKFLPGEHCTFGDHHACVATFQKPEEAPVIWLTIHSGVGGEGQPFRNAVEGTGINEAAYSLPKTLTNLQILTGSQVVISQGTTTARDLQLQVTARIPGSMLQGYFNTPLENTLDFSSQAAPQLLPMSHPSQPIIVFETCGWRIAGQPWFPGSSDTTASVYLGIIQQAP